ncbi:hypothetical protein [Candidatus Tisiphia endosymbiont of Piscicola geometra]|uniref:hypothetical protein n=1 Tax=Candidatus Tisiphia endosymbiont of Piscicola geometra TaxID=3066273 RepID=UPI00312CA930
MRITKEQKQEYLQRFVGAVPLVIYPHDPYLHKCKPTFVESEIDLEYGLNQIQNIQLNKQYKIIAGFKKAKLEDFIHFDWLMGGGGIPDLFNKCLVKKMQNICPNDFIALPVILINLSDKIASYENKDFYVVNALNTIDAIDREKSVIRYSFEGDKGRVIKRIYKEYPWQGHLIAFDTSIYNSMIYHPKLAKELYPSKQFQFLTPEEDSYLHNWREPDHEQNPKWKDRKWWKFK